MKDAKKVMVGNFKTRTAPENNDLARTQPGISQEGKITETAAAGEKIVPGSAMDGSQTVRTLA